MDVDLSGSGKQGAGGTGGTPKKRRPIFSMVMGFLMWPIFFVGFGSAPSCMGFEEPTLRAIEACPPLAAALGTPVSRSYLGMSCGNAETNDAFGNASWSFPVSGPNGSGSVDVVAEMRGGPWRVLRATVETGAGTWEAVSCSGGGGSFTVVPTRLDATVTEAIGTAPAAAGTACTIDIAPGDGPFPCRVVIACGGRTLYGITSSTGYMQCTPDARGALSANDTSPTPDDNDPMLDLRVGDGRAILTDSGAGGMWVLTLSFAPPAGLAPPAPAPGSGVSVPTSAAPAMPTPAAAAAPAMPSGVAAPPGIISPLPPPSGPPAEGAPPAPPPP